LILLSKLFFSAATACLGAGYAARWRANPLHRRLMATGVVLAWGGALVPLLGWLALGLPVHPAFWLEELTGSTRAAGILAIVQQALGGVALATLTAQAVLGRLRHPLHRPLAWAALPLWLLIWVTTMFGYV
jgi:hypothetical protein